MSKLPNKFACAVEASGLVGAEKLAECLQLLGDQATDDRLADLLLHRKLLTKWQLKQLQGGKSCTFFLGQYLLLEPIGSGGMGRVFQALDTKVGRQVAIKLLPEGRATPKAIERLRREGQAALALQHENIVRTFELGQHAETHFLVMELVEGVDLAKHLAKHGKLSAKETARIGYEVALALDHAWKNGLIHRDIKPTNLMVTSEGRVKLLDLGLAKFFRSHQDRPATLTNTGAIMGTMDYMAPEQAEDGKRADCRSDIYSLGCTLYECLTGRTPFASGTLVQKIVAHRQSEPPSIAGLNGDVPQALADVIEKRMLAKHPDDRFQTPAEAVDALNPWPYGNSQVIDATRRHQNEERQPTETTTNLFAPGALLRAKSEHTESRANHRWDFARGRFAMILVAFLCVLIGWGLGGSWRHNQGSPVPQLSDSNVAMREPLVPLTQGEQPPSAASADDQSLLPKVASTGSPAASDEPKSRSQENPVSDKVVAENRNLPNDNAAREVDPAQPPNRPAKMNDPAYQPVPEKPAEVVPAKPNINAEAKPNNAKAQDIDISPEVAATVRKLILELSSKDAAAREQAAKQLGVLGPQAKAAVPTLINVLRRPRKVMTLKNGDLSLESHEHDECAAALASIGLASIPALIEGLSDKYTRRNSAAPTDLSRNSADVLSRIGVDAVPALIDVLKSDDGFSKEQALEALSMIGPEAKAAVPALSLIVKQEEVDFNRARAWSVLQNTNTNATAKLLTEVLTRSKDLKARFEIVDGLYWYKRRPRFEHVMPTLKECAPAFIDVFINSKIDSHDHYLAKNGLIAIGKQRMGLDDDVLRPLIEILKSDDVTIVRDAVEILDSFGPDAKAAVPSWTALLSHQDVLVRLNSAKALAKIGPSGNPAIPTLESLSKDPSQAVRTAAQASIKAINAAIVLESRKALEAAEKKVAAENEKKNDD